MNLKDYLAGLERGGAATLAKELRVSPSYLSQLAAGDTNISPARAVEIEEATGGQVTRKDTHPDDWWRIWPELDGASAARAAEAQVQSASATQQ